jgi:hypothetical protein
MLHLVKPIEDNEQPALLVEVQKTAVAVTPDLIFVSKERSQ